MKVRKHSMGSKLGKILLGTTIFSNFIFGAPGHKIKNRDESINKIEVNLDTTNVIKFKNRNQSNNQLDASFRYAGDVSFKNKGWSNNKYTIYLEGNVGNLEVNGIKTDIIHKYSQKQLEEFRRELNERIIESNELMRDFIYNEIDKSQTQIKKDYTELVDITTASTKRENRVLSNRIGLNKKDINFLEGSVQDNAEHIKVLYSLSGENANLYQDLLGIHSTDTTRTNERFVEAEKDIKKLEKRLNEQTTPETIILIGAGIYSPINKSQNYAPNLNAELIHSPNKYFSAGAFTKFYPLGSKSKGIITENDKQTKYIGGNITKETETNTVETIQDKSYIQFGALAQANLGKWNIGYSYSISPKKSTITTDQENTITYTSQGVPYQTDVISNQDIKEKRGIAQQNRLYVGRDFGKNLGAQISAEKHGKYFGLSANAGYKIPLKKNNSR